MPIPLIYAYMTPLKVFIKIALAASTVYLLQIAGRYMCVIGVWGQRQTWKCVYTNKPFAFSPLSYYYIKRVRANHGKRSVLSDSTGE